MAITLTVGEEARIAPVLHVASINQSVTVEATRVAGTESTRTVLGRTFTDRGIDGLPVPGRDFTTLATLTPGVFPDLNQGGGFAPNLTGFATAAQMGRNNAILIDGLSHDDAMPGAMRGIVSLDAVKEFVVSTNGFAAEYGQASGAVVNVVTRSGTNTVAARGFYFHRDGLGRDARLGKARQCRRSTRRGQSEHLSAARQAGRSCAIGRSTSGRWSSSSATRTTW